MASVSASRPAASSARRRSLACSTPTMFSWLAAPERQARIGRGQHLAHDLLRGEVGVDGPHPGAVDHHVGHREIAQVEQAAEHVALGFGDPALPMQQVDLAADLLGRRRGSTGARRCGRRRAAASSAPAARWRASRGRTAPPSRRRGRAMSSDDAVGRVDRDGLRQHLGEDDHQHRHDHGGVDARPRCRTGRSARLW